MANKKVKKWRLKQIVTQKIFDICPTEGITAGRHANAKLCLKSNKVSRQHACFVVNIEGNLLIQDLKSANGTFINAEPIKEYTHVRVNHGAIISFGLQSMDHIDEKDKLCFFEVILVEESKAKERVSVEPKNKEKSTNKEKPENSSSDKRKMLSSEGNESISKKKLTTKNRRKLDLIDNENQEKLNNSVEKVTPSNNNIKSNQSTSKTPTKTLKTVNRKRTRQSLDEASSSNFVADPNYRRVSVDSIQTGKEFEFSNNNKTADKVNNNKKVEITSKLTEEKRLSQEKEKNNFNENDLTLKSESPFLNDTKNSHEDIIELSDDEDISCSQIFQMSMMIKAEPDDFQKIKTEIAEMDWVLNPLPINLDDDFNLDNTGFDDTQELFNFLEDRNDKTIQTTSATSITSNNLEPLETSNIEKTIQKIRKSPRTKLTLKYLDTVPSTSSSKRKLPLETPVENKKAKNDTKSPRITKKSKQDATNLLENDKNKICIRDARQKKLKELASPIQNKPKSPKQKVVTPNKKVNNSEAKGDNRKSPNKINNLELPPPTFHNLRRVKSSDEIKLQKPKNPPIPNQNRPATRHSTSLAVANQQSVQTLDARLQSNAQMPQRSQYSTAADEASRRLMWTNGGPSKKNMHYNVRRLPGVDDIIKKIIRWNPKWLLHQTDEHNFLPCLNNPPATSIPLNFRDFNQYYETFYKLILLESWDYLYKTFRESPEEPVRTIIEHKRVVHDMIFFDCLYYISKKQLDQSKFYKQDDMVLLEFALELQDELKQCVVTFGLIQSYKLVPLTDNTKISQLLGEQCPGIPHMAVHFVVMVPYDSTQEINIKKRAVIKFVGNLRGTFMQLRAIKYMGKSQLCPMILNPKISDYKFPTTHKNITHPNKLNSQQKAIVLEAASLCTGNKAGIYAIKGPPGTGKSYVIVNIICQILFSCQKNKCKEKPMILLVAPSNTAVDNLMSKLNDVKQCLSPELRYQIKCVRIGPEASISREAKGYSLHNLAERHVVHKNCDLIEVQDAMRRNEDMIKFCKYFFGNRYSDELKLCENIILEKSNVILTTPGSSINKKLLDAFNRNLINFTCCIVDEATQCHEVECLLPCLLGVNKFVLVGDPQQLNATVMNREAAKLGFAESLFSRLENNFKNDPRTPIKMLRDQYRMHPEICSFPNQQFYQGKLRSCSNPLNKLPDKLHPYLVFNCVKQDNAGDYINMEEVQIVKKLLTTIFSMVNRGLRYSVGIITPYNAQKDLIGNNIKDIAAENSNWNITINTVDSFQGSENDIVIISCVRYSSNTFVQNVNRLNVALTRAKQALYIVGSKSLFKECRTLYDLREDAKRRNLCLDINLEAQQITSFQKYLYKK